ncbi:MAG: purine-nucleoside phosphorylase [Clostridiaceae bacterium]|nr:purine-nucleoside phosphorylase [Clostridiaceae bacterium]
MKLLLNKMKDSTKYIKDVSSINPEIGIILGSGLGMLAKDIEDEIIIPYKDIPYFPVSTVKGHKCQLVLGYLSGKPVICMQGRFHYYEGYSMQNVVYPVRIMQMLGVSKLIVTNSAGGINTDFQPGDLMIIIDHINLMGINPLIGKNYDDFGERFPDMTRAYDSQMMDKAAQAADSLAIQLKRGVYAAMTGPSYETPAEIRFLRAIGADAVGMSTVPEVIVANHSGIKTVGISCITNMAAGILDQPLSHDEVMEISTRVKNDFINLMNRIVKTI